MPRSSFDFDHSPPIRIVATPMCVTAKPIFAALNHFWPRVRKRFITTDAHTRPIRLANQYDL